MRCLYFADQESWSLWARVPSLFVQDSGNNPILDIFQGSKAL
jgi:hypothetical protein